MKRTSLTYQQIVVSSKRPLIIAVVSDTHTTEASPEFNPELINKLSDIKPDYILHLGDLAYPKSLNYLQQIAPCSFVRGNRDLTNYQDAPSVITFEIGRWKFLITHGHGTVFHYLFDKLKYGIYGYDFNRYRLLVNTLGPDANAYLFGHTHVKENRWIDEKLYFNPGASCLPNGHDPHPSFGLITIKADDSLSSEIIPLDTGGVHQGFVLIQPD